MGLSKTLKLLIQKSLSVKPNSQYNFLLKKLYKSKDIDIINKAIGTDYFKENLKPQPLDFKNWKKIIVFAPHQDDEIIGCGGLLYHLKNQNCKIELVFLTDGRPMSSKSEEVVKQRSQESEKVAKALNAEISNININNISLKIGSYHLDKLINKLKNNSYDAIFTPWVFDYPPKHRLCNYFLSKCFRKSELKLNTQVYNYQVHNILIPNVYYDYTKFFKEKQLLIHIYKSQLKNQNYAHLSQGIDSWNSRILTWSTKERYIEVYHQIPLKAYYELIRYYDIDIKKTFKSHKACIDSYKNIKKL